MKTLSNLETDLIVRIIDAALLKLHPNAADYVPLKELKKYLAAEKPKPPSPPPAPPYPVIVVRQ